MAECDARLCADRAGKPGRIDAIISTPTGAVEENVPVTECAGPMFKVWHGMDTPALACDRHAGGRMVDVAVFRGHRNRMTRQN